jgi:hypothetical protein
MSFENFERGYLLPKGCKDLIDAIRLPAYSKKHLEPPPLRSKPIPSWRIVLYSLSLMTGVNFLAKPDGHPIVGWLLVVLAGAFIAFYCLYLNSELDADGSSACLVLGTLRLAEKHSRLLPLAASPDISAKRCASKASMRVVLRNFSGIFREVGV